MIKLLIKVGSKVIERAYRDNIGIFRKLSGLGHDNKEKGTK
jgi:hypothetical protein